MTTVAERVDRGAAWLDRTFADWEDKIDVDNIEIRSSSGCIIGQLFGGWHQGFDHWLGSDRFLAHSLGFVCCARGTESCGDVDKLNQAWRDYVIARRSPALNLVEMEPA